MKRVIPFLILFLLPCFVLGAEEYVLKLRTSYNAGYTRIVLEGPEPVITRALVNQTEQDILVTFLRAYISVRAEKPFVSFRMIDNNKIMFSPGRFSGMKVLTLRDPVRLVIDVYPDNKKKEGEGWNRGSSILEKENTGKFSGREEEAVTSEKMIVIDPGHGGFESGMIKDDFEEKNVALDISRKLGALIDKGGLRSSLTRSGDLFMSMDERVRSANSSRADVFISVHIGNHRDVVIYIPVVTESVQEGTREYLYNKGQETYLKKTVALLNAVKDAAAEDFGNDMVTVRPLPYSILSRIEAAALMIELPSFGYENYTEDFKLRVANMINRGLYQYEQKEAE
jgi:N-acetylmuramoyl-L-alanine amidase